MSRTIIINHSVKLDIFWLLKTTINSSLKVLVEIAKRLYVVFYQRSDTKVIYEILRGSPALCLTEIEKFKGLHWEMLILFYTPFLKTRSLFHT